MEESKITAVFEQFEEEFNKSVVAGAIVLKLRNKKILPQAIEKKINQADDDYQANSILYSHMKEQADQNVAKTLFNVMSDAEGYRKMNTLGRKMLNALEADPTSSMPPAIRTAQPTPLPTAPPTAQPTASTRTSTITGVPPPSSSTEGQKVRFAIMTANDNEWEAALHFLDDVDLSKETKDDMCKLGLHQHKDDDSLNCHFTENIRRYKAINVGGVCGVLLKCFNVGGTTFGGSSDMTTLFLKDVEKCEWPLKVVFIVGCCGAHSNDGSVPEGTILVAENVLAYVHGKIEESGMKLSRPNSHETDLVWLSVIDQCKTKPKYEIKPKHFKGVQFLSDDLVIKTRYVARLLHEKIAPTGSAVGIEMEGTGVFSAINACKTWSKVKSPTVILVKGVSDNAGPDKNTPKDIVFFSDTKGSVDDDCRQRMCTIMSLTLVLRAIITNKHSLLED